MTPEELKASFDRRVEATKLVWERDVRTIGLGTLVRLCAEVVSALRDLGRLSGYGATEIDCGFRLREHIYELRIPRARIVARLREIQDELDRRFPAPEIPDEP